MGQGFFFSLRGKLGVNTRRRINRHGPTCELQEDIIWKWEKTVPRARGALNKYILESPVFINNLITNCFTTVLQNSWAYVRNSDSLRRRGIMGMEEVLIYLFIVQPHS